MLKCKENDKRSFSDHAHHILYIVPTDDERIYVKPYIEYIMVSFISCRKHTKLNFTNKCHKN